MEVDKEEGTFLLKSWEAEVVLLGPAELGGVYLTRPSRRLVIVASTLLVVTADAKSEVGVRWVWCGARLTQVLPDDAVRHLR